MDFSFPVQYQFTTGVYPHGPCRNTPFPQNHPYAFMYPESVHRPSFFCGSSSPRMPEGLLPFGNHRFLIGWIIKPDASHPEWSAPWPYMRAPDPPVLSVTTGNTGNEDRWGDVFPSVFRLIFSTSEICRIPLIGHRFSAKCVHGINQPDKRLIRVFNAIDKSPSARHRRDPLRGRSYQYSWQG